MLKLHRIKRGTPFERERGGDREIEGLVEL
jgi:hypothetical protein